MPDDDQCGGSFANPAQNITRDILYPVSNGEAHDPEKIGCSICHGSTLCAQRTIFNLTICAQRT